MVEGKIVKLIELIISLSGSEPVRLILRKIKHLLLEGTITYEMSGSVQNLIFDILKIDFSFQNRKKNNHKNIIFKIWYFVNNLLAITDNDKLFDSSGVYFFSEESSVKNLYFCTYEACNSFEKILTHRHKLLSPFEFSGRLYRCGEYIIASGKKAEALLIKKGKALCILDNFTFIGSGFNKIYCIIGAKPTVQYLVLKSNTIETKPTDIPASYFINKSAQFFFDASTGCFIIKNHYKLVAFDENSDLVEVPDEYFTYLFACSVIYQDKQLFHEKQELYLVYLIKIIEIIKEKKTLCDSTIDDLIAPLDTEAKEVIKSTIEFAKSSPRVSCSSNPLHEFEETLMDILAFYSLRAKKKPYYFSYDNYNILLQKKVIYSNTFFYILRQHTYI